MATLYDTAYWPQMVDYLEDKEQLYINKLKSVDPNDTAAIARIQGRLEAYKDIKSKPEECYRQNRRNN